MNPYVLACVAMVAVMSSDYLIFWLGQTAGPRLFKIRAVKRLFKPGANVRIRRWINNHGYWAVIVFRFTPGVRFPGHLMCGAMGLKPLRFAAIDFFAAAISVPTQVLLLSFYGESILGEVQRYKIMVALVLLTVLAAFFLRRFLGSRPRKGRLNGGAVATAAAAASGMTNEGHE